MTLARDRMMSQGRIVEEVVAGATRSFCHVGYVSGDIMARQADAAREQSADVREVSTTIAEHWSG